MKNISPTLKAALATGKRCYLIKITTTQGIDYGYTNHDKQLLVGGITYIPSPGLKHLNTYYSDSAEVSTSKFKMAYVDIDEELVRSGVFDNAEYLILRVAWDDLDAGSYEHDRGRLAVNKWDENEMTHESQGYERDLVRKIGSQHTLACPHQFGDQFNRTKPGACTLSIASFTSSSSVVSIEAQRMKITIGSTGEPDKEFNNGILTWTSGNNTNTSVPVKIHNVGGTETIEFAIPTFLLIEVGDGFNVVSGCDKTFSQCNSKFNNAINFGGDPFINSGVTRR